VADDQPLTQGQDEAVIYAAGLLLGLAGRFEAHLAAEDAEGVRETARWLARQFPQLGMPTVERPAGDEPAPGPS